MLDLVEKPKLEDAPSNLAVIGRYILTPAIFETLSDIKPGAGGELQLTDGLRALLKREKMYAYVYEGTAPRYRRQAWLPEGDGGVRAKARGSGRGVSGVFEGAEILATSRER